MPMLMRALGPGSVSSLLKIILDITWVVLTVFMCVFVVLILLALLLPVDLPFWSKIIVTSDAGQELRARGPLLAAGLAAGAAYFGGVQIIVGRLRKIFVTLTAGDPFHPDNVSRLRLIGLILAGLEVGHYLFGIAAKLVVPNEIRALDMGINFTTWFAVLVIFVLAEVFREGARLRRESELTI